MISRLLKRLEDPERPLLGPNIKALKFWGLLLPKKKFQRLLYLFLYISSIIFIFTECVDMWLVRRDFDLFLDNLKYVTTSMFNILKALLMFVWQGRWKQIIEFVNRADRQQRKTSNPDNIFIIRKYTVYCRKMTYMYWSLIFLTGFIVILHPLLKFALSASYRNNVKDGSGHYIEVARSWVPFDKTTVGGYIVALTFQSYVTIFCIGWITSFDTLAIVVLVFFRVEVEVLRNDCREIFYLDDGVADGVDIFRRFNECHRRHAELIRFAQLFNSCLSPAMFFYILICSLTLCVTAFQVTEQTSAMQILLLLEFLTFAVLQLLFYFWHINEVTCASRDLMLGPYESKWWFASASRQRDICILIHQFSKPIVFTAGPFVELNIATFISIIKGAYSYYTILNQVKD